MNDKIKEKIEKLLNLSMSDNEHEASLALERALKLMNEHNISKDEVYKQNFVSHEINFEVYRLQDWNVELYSGMANVSGCMFTWINGFNNKARGNITGRERDVENAVYLANFLSREISRQEKIKKKELKERGIRGSELASYIKGFKKGIIKSVFTKLWNQQTKFFNQQKQEAGLVLMDIESKIKDSEAFFGDKFEVYESKAKTDKRAEADGILTGKDITINQAVARQDEIKQIGA